MTLNDVFLRAEEIPIEDVASTACGLKLQLTGGRYQCLCPNPAHNDKHMGSFSINPHNRYWGCFACDLGKHRGNVSLVSKINNISMVEAALLIAETYHIISASEAQEFMAKYKTAPPKKLPTPVILAKPSTNRKPIEHLDKVYRCFIAAAPEMTDAQKEDLKTKRFLSDSDLAGFFLLPSKTSAFWKQFQAELKNAGLGDDLTAILTGVPGFYQYKSSSGWTFCGSAGELCLISHNEDGLIRGFQIRRNTTEKGSRYISFSSGSISPDKFKNGCSSGVLIDVIPPIGKKRSSIIAFTEGKFKAIALAKMGVWAVSIPGVGNYRHGVAAAEDIIKKNHIKNPTYLICYDMDMKQNYSVAKNARQLCAFLQDLNMRLGKGSDCVYFGEWDEECGKGIDDVINNGHGDKLEHVKAKTFLKRPFFQPPVKTKQKM